MHRFARLVAGLLLLVTVGAACGGSEHAKGPKPPKPFCDAAYDYEQELNKELTKGEKDVARQLTFVQKMADLAPKAIHQDVTDFLAALQQVKDDPSLARNKRFQARGRKIVANVNRYASNGCGFFNEDPSQGL